MEKLDLQKFDNYSLDNKELSYVHAGECDTAGGINAVYTTQGGGGHDYYRYSSDYINSSGATFYNGYHYSFTIDTKIHENGGSDH